MISRIVWFFGLFTLEHVPSMNSIWIITPSSVFHVQVTTFKASLLFKLSILTSNNVIGVGIFSILFNDAQQVIKISTAGYVSVSFMRSSIS